MFVIYQKCIVTIFFTVVNKSVHSYDTRQSSDLHISRNQLAKELFSILEVFCGILYHQFLKNACLKKSFKSKLKMYLLSKMVAN